MIIVDGLLAMMAYNLLSGIMRSLGDSKTPLYFLIVSSIVNIILALVFIIIFGWGVPGSAFALVIAQAFFRSAVRNLYLQALSAAAYSSQRLSIGLAGAVGASAYGPADGGAVLRFGTWYYYPAVSLQQVLAVIRLPALLRQCA